MKLRSREQSTKGETEIETLWGWEGKKEKKTVRQIRSKGRFEVQTLWGWEGKKKERFTDSETVRLELELGDVRKACMSEAVSLRWGVSEAKCV